MVSPRVLLIAEAANPEWPSVPLVGWSHAHAIQSLCDAHLVTQVRNEPAIHRAGLSTNLYTIINSEAIMRPLWQLSTLIRGDANKGWTTSTALQAIGYPFFESLVWKHFKNRLRAGEFDLVHRITPLSPTMPSPIARKLRKIGVPFILGPLNGGVPWPSQFDSARRKEQEWLSYVRNGYKLLPGYQATRKYANAIICGSRATLEQMPIWCRNKCIYIPENAIDPARFPKPTPKPPPTPLRVVFLGRLVPYKGADMLIEATAPLVHDGKVVVEIIGDGPEMARLRLLSTEKGIEHGVTFTGWIPHDQVHQRLSRAHVFGFPSIREFGGGAVLEAMACGVVPIVIDYAGPGELVTPTTGISIPIGSRSDIIRRYHEALLLVLSNQDVLESMRKAAATRVSRYFTWDAKARQVLDVYRWVLGYATKPEWGFLAENPS